MRKCIPYRAVSTCLLLLPTLTIAQAASAKQLVLDAKPSVVRIEAGCTGTYRYTEYFKDGKVKSEENERVFAGGTGSGFFINTEGYIVTNAHVVSTVEKGENGCKSILFNKLVEKVTGDKPEDVSAEVKSRIRNDSKLEDFVLYQNVVLFNESSGDRGYQFKFDLKKLGKPIQDTKDSEGGNKDVAVIKIALKNTPALLLSDPAEIVQYQDKVTTIGYPGAADLNEKALSEASVMDNTVANPNKILADRTPVIQLNQTILRGTSGGPVLNEQGKVIGIATFSFGNDAEEVAFAVPASVIREFLSPAGATNQTGTINELYQQGLQLYGRGEYEGAKLKFEAVKGLFKYHSEIDRLIRDSNQKIAERAVSPQFLFWGVIGGFTTLILVIAYLLFRQKPTQQMAGIPVGLSVPDVSGKKRDRKSWRAISKAASGLFRPTSVSSLHRINLKNGEGNQLSLNLNQSEHRLGRDVSWSNIKFPTQGWGVISRKQAIFRKKGDIYYLFDGDGNGTSSTNGIYLDGTPIPSSGIELRDGMQVKIGNDPSNLVTLSYSNANGQIDRTDVSHQ
ncbi:trypsin-like peptidase domain-containing protein [Leptolyngbya sp. AN03gr2]|uniref:trypsin-like peptidase domain-containing protein n=1 Tax=unclassified Leptolyngbya TaxID=2650499 RepID=UPI003D3204BB